MKMKQFSVSTDARTQFLDITLTVNQILNNCQCMDGLVTIFVPHTTAALTINENADPNVKHDLDYKINKLIPKDEAAYLHDEGNSDSHMKSSLFSPSLTCIVEDGSVQLGTWQGIYLCEFDGPRTRQVWVKVISG